MKVLERLKLASTIDINDFEWTIATLDIRNVEFPVIAMVSNHDEYALLLHAIKVSPGHISNMSADEVESAEPKDVLMNSSVEFDQFTSQAISVIRQDDIISANSLSNDISLCYKHFVVWMIELHDALRQDIKGTRIDEQNIVTPKWRRIIFDNQDEIEHYIEANSISDFVDGEYEEPKPKKTIH